MKTLRFEIEDGASRSRIDKVLGDLCGEELSRTRVKALIEQGHVRLNGEECDTPSRKIKAGDVLEVDVPPPVAAEPGAENIALDVVYEDSDLLVINKPAGMVVHPGAGNYSGTLVNALLHRNANDLSGIGGVLRPGIVHRLDKETSGLMVAAKNDIAHRGLAEQLESRTLKRVYKALVLGVPFPHKGTVDLALGRHPASRIKMSVRRKGGKDAKTHYTVEKKFGKEFALVECRLETGRTHQIRVHMESLKHPLIGDPIYGPQDSALKAALKRGGWSPEAAKVVLDFPRQALHAQFMSFIHPVSRERLDLEAPLPGDFVKILKSLDK
ncbi:MAG: RluA family pseudouridine synthase [Alphaproteobacteria bacterium]